MTGLAWAVLGLAAGLVAGYALRAAIGRDDTANACRDRDQIITRLETRISAARHRATKWATAQGRRASDPVQADCGRQILGCLDDPGSTRW